MAEVGVEVGVEVVIAIAAVVVVSIFAGKEKTCGCRRAGRYSIVRANAYRSTD